MAKVIHGEIKFEKPNYGQLSDLMCILVTNGYVVEIIPQKGTTEVTVLVMTEVD